MRQPRHRCDGVSRGVVNHSRQTGQRPELGVLVEEMGERSAKGELPVRGAGVSGAWTTAQDQVLDVCDLRWEGKVVILLNQAVSSGSGRLTWLLVSNVGGHGSHHGRGTVKENYTA